MLCQPDEKISSRYRRWSTQRVSGHSRNFGSMALITLKRPVAPPSLLTGYLIVLGSLLFLIVGSYATLFSALWPLRGWNPVSTCDSCFKENMLTHLTGRRYAYGRYSLQVLLPAPCPYQRILCDCQLGGLAILPQFIESASVCGG